MKLLRIVGFAEGGASEYDGQYLERYDPEWMGGLGRVWATLDPAKAMRFESLSKALEYWRQPSKVRPRRGDGKPNRPLTALTVEVVDA